MRRTGDGVLVVHHDSDVAGARADRRNAARPVREVRPNLTTLADALAELSGLLVNVEVKCLPWEPDADGDGTVMRATVDAIRAPTKPAAIVSSFFIGAVDTCRALAPRSRRRG